MGGPEGINTHTQSEQPQRTIGLDQIISRAMLHYKANKIAGQISRYTGFPSDTLMGV